MSEYLQKIIYLTKAQYNTLQGGGTVGSQTGLNNSYLYCTTDEKIGTTDLAADLIVPVTKGGTGKTSFTAGSVLVGNGQAALTELPATNQNTANTLVKRDGSGNFSAGTITARITGAAATTTTNAVAYYTNTTGTFGSKASADGVLYATAANGALNWGTLPVAQGGTGATSATAARTNLGLGSIAIKAETDFLPVKYTAPDFTATNTTNGVYPLIGGNNPVTGTGEYGGVLQFGASSTSANYYAAQLIISSASGGTSPVHAYIRRMTSTPTWSNWTTLLDNKNTTAPSSVPQLSWNNESTVFTLNGTAVKIKAMAKPTCSDIGAKPTQTAVSSPSVTDETADAFIDTISQNANGVISVTKRKVPNKLSIIKNNAATCYLMGTTTAVTDEATTVTAVASTAMTYNGADKGTARITLGTSTATTSTGGQYGELFLYSTGTNGTSIKAAANSTAAYVATLQAATGTIAYTGDITSAIEALDVTEKTNTASQTIDKISETDGKISVTFKNISITKSQVSDFPTTMTPSSHAHGNITNTGTIGTAGKKMLVIVGTDNKVTTGAEIGTGTTTFLNNSGAWTTPANNAVTHSLKNTTKFYVTGTESSTGSTGGDSFDTGVYVTTTEGQLNAASYLVSAHVMLSYNTTDQSLDFSFV